MTSTHHLHDVSVGVPVVEVPDEGRKLHSEAYTRTEVRHSLTQTALMGHPAHTSTEERPS